MHITTNGRRRKLTKREAIIAQVVDKSASTDLRATKMLIDMMKDAEHKARTAPSGRWGQRGGATVRGAATPADTVGNRRSEDGSPARIAFPARSGRGSPSPPCRRNARLEIGHPRAPPLARGREGQDIAPNRASQRRQRTVEMVEIRSSPERPRKATWYR
jgi:hypothetical protein